MRRRSLGFAEEILSIGLVVPLELRISIVEKECFQAIVQLVRPQHFAVLLEREVHPVRMLGAVSETVVVNRPQPLTQNLGVHARVEGVARHAEDGKLRQIRA